MDLQRAVVVGHSMGGRIALLLAARRPDLLRALVLVEASPAKAPDADENVRRWLAKWPASFASTKEARTFFADLGLAPDAWAANLERNSGRLYPQFDADLMLEISKDVAYSDYWGDWKRVQAPTLLVRGEMGTVPREDYTRMQVLNPAATYAEVAGAGHDVHLESPKGWQKALSPFLDDCTS
jgi:pimeloyl-ACP methyl ester carboxylesterase